MAQCRLSALLLLIALTGACSSDDARTLSETSAAPGSPTNATPQPLPDAKALIKRLATQDGARDLVADMRLSSRDENGKTIQVEFRMQRKYSDDQVSTLLTVTAPREDTEKALLAVERGNKPTEAISYLAGLKKIARFRSNSLRDFRGAKIHLQELLGLELLKYDVVTTERVSEDNNSLIRVELKEKPDTELAFPRAALYFSDPGGDGQPSPRRIEMFDSQGNKTRIVHISEVRDVQQHQTITRLKMENPATGRTVTLEALNIRYDQNLSDSIFTEAHLTRLITEASRRLIQ